MPDLKLFVKNSHVIKSISKITFMEKNYTNLQTLIAVILLWGGGDIRKMITYGIVSGGGGPKLPES